ncbi:MAG: hypothetical protein DRO94_05200 [Candidatus Altiarchaeales archaeon]|nr:MAG: hypothetical protein DRO95_04365 [Candidatus Altiarchaeales archaeon]RLI93444.1 MAG: hypothetical protein DRO94_05200 [Candidatus Altiarchaeales archaeon]HDO82682.1 hypothetical protein [Candidatus Altiarchaeales archaeon]HEX55331.1 hypothetical protein [Candidatus Altiarchaeales archaeon]
MKHPRAFLIFFILFALLNVVNAQVYEINKVTIDFFYSPTCPHCKKEMEFLRELEEEYPRLKVNYHIASEDRDLFFDMCKRYNTTPVGVPRTFIGNKVFIGFSEEDGDLEWSQAYLAYIGYKNQIENSIRECMNLSSIISESDAITISRTTPIVKNFTSTYRDASANAFLFNETYAVAWWSKDRIKSRLQYPNIIVYIDAKTGQILRSEIPDSEIEGIEKPRLIDNNYIFYILVVILFIFILAFMIIGTRIEGRYWLVGFCIIFFMFAFFFAGSISENMIVKFARKFSMPIFTFLIAIIDGFNPCAFTVLAFLLSLLTYTKSRRKMLLIGFVFIVTSGLMYSIFIILLLIVRAQLLSQFQDIVRILVSIIAIGAGIINLKDFFLMKKYISLTISEEKRNKIFRRIGRLVHKLKKISSGKELILVVLSTIALAIMVNIIELGCTFILPMIYIESLIQNFSASVGTMHIIYTLFYGIVYVLPLFAILGIFLLTFKSERITERQGRILKLIGGLLMISLGAILLLKPELLMFK